MQGVYRNDFLSDLNVETIVRNNKNDFYKHPSYGE